MRIAGLLSLGATAVAIQGQGDIPTRAIREELRITSNDSSLATMFVGVSSGSTVLRDGRILTTHPSEGVARLFSPEGKLLRVFGGPGDGPGEFRNPQGAGQLSDTIWVNDGARGRFVLYDKALKWIGYVDRPDGSNTQVVLSGGVVMGFSGGNRRALYDKDGKLLRTIDYALPSVPHHTFEVRDRGAPGTASQLLHLPSPFRAIARSLVSRDGRDAIFLEPGELWNGRPGQLRYHRLSTTTWQLGHPVVISLPPRRISAAEKDSILDEQAPSERVRADYKAGARMPEYYPSYQYFTLMGDSMLWITEFGIPNSWTLIDMSLGRAVMRLRFPPSFIPFAATSTQVWGTLKDQDGIPIVVRYRIQ